jgi:FLVCR family feline leukemia virus subgroup C receptor-related protein
VAPIASKTPGLYNGIFVGSFLNMLGALLRYLGSRPDSFGLLFAGQTVSSCAQAFILGIPPRLASIWFGENERNLASSIAVNANTLGIALSFFITPLSINSKTMEQDFTKYLLVQFIVCAVLFLVIALFFKNNPKTPPSSSTAALQESNLLGDIVNLMKNRTFLLHFIAYGINIGIQYAFTTLLATMTVAIYPEKEVRNVILLDLV